MRPSFTGTSKSFLWGALALGLAILTGLALLRPPASLQAASGQTQVFLSTTGVAEVGQTIIVKLVANNAKDLAGFQATLTFDPNVIHLTNATLSSELSRTGRGLLALGPVIGYDTATLGAATCPMLACDNLAEARLAQRQTQGVYGRVELAEFEIFIVAPGAHSLTLSDVQLVSPNGSALDAALSPTVSINVGQP